MSDPRAMDVPVPAIGGFRTARALATMYAMLAGGGTWNGREVLDRAVEAVRIRADGQCRFACSTCGRARP